MENIPFPLLWQEFFQTDLDSGIFAERKRDRHIALNRDVIGGIRGLFGIYSPQTRERPEHSWSGKLPIVG